MGKGVRRDPGPALAFLPVSELQQSKGTGTPKSSEWDSLVTGVVRPQSPFYRGCEGGLDVGVLGPQPHPDSGQTEGNRLQGGLAKPQASGKLYFLDVTLCLGQEDETLEEQGDLSASTPTEDHQNQGPSLNGMCWQRLSN